MAHRMVPGGGTAKTVASLLDSPEIDGLIEGLETLRETGRPGYGSRALVGACLVKSLYSLPTWSRTTRLIGEHQGLQDALGGAPSQDAIYRFTEKLRGQRGLLERCIGRVTEALQEKLPEYGRDVAVDASDLPAYANGQKYKYKGGPVRENFSDPDATWGAPIHCLDAQGRRVLRVPGSHGRVLADRSTVGVGCEARERGREPRGPVRARPDRRAGLLP